MGVQVELGLDSLNHLGVQVAGVEYRNTTGEVDEAATFHIPELGVAGVLDENLVGLTDTACNGRLTAGIEGGIENLAISLHKMGSGVVERVAEL